MKRYEIIIHGRGGQGAKTSAELLAQAGLKSGLFVQAFPEFGPERSGAPVRTFVRWDDKFIHSHEPVVAPEVILILDDTLLKTKTVLQNIHLANLVVINSGKSSFELEKEIVQALNLVEELKGKIISIDASGIAREIIGQNRANTVILGRFAKETDKINVNNLAEAFREKYLAKIGEDLTEKNIRAMRMAAGVGDVSGQEQINN